MSSLPWSAQITAPRLIALLLLAFFAAQCAYFISHVPLTQVEANYVYQGIAQLRGLNVSADHLRSPLVPLASVIGIAPVLPAGDALDQFWLDAHRWNIRLPFLFAGFLLGASLWYVARRLYGSHAGYLALGVYAFSPGLIARSSLAGPEILGAWGAFGMIFTAIATAHTLYAPREVVLWNWKRITILGISIALAVGSQWSLALVLIPALAYMLWAVPHRRLAALSIMAAACAVALLLLSALYGLEFGRFAQDLATSRVLGISVESTVHAQMLRAIGSFFVNGSPATLLCFVIAITTFAAWRRTRFFGNAAPLIVAVMLLVFGFVLPHSGGAMFFFYALPFLLLFSSGVFADLFESQSPSVPIGVAYGGVVAQVVYSVAGLMRVFSRGM